MIQMTKNPLKDADELFGEKVGEKYEDLGFRIPPCSQNFTILFVLKTLDKIYENWFGEDYEARELTDIDLEAEILESKGFEVLYKHERQLSAKCSTIDGEISIDFDAWESRRIKKTYSIKFNIDEEHDGCIYGPLKRTIKILEERRHRK